MNTDVDVHIHVQGGAGNGMHVLGSGKRSEHRTASEWNLKAEWQLMILLHALHP